jgi:hypothetical protein
MSNRRVFLGLVVGVTLLCMGLILTDRFPWLRGPAPDTDVWHWPYQLTPITRWLVPLTAVVYLLLLTNWWVGKAAFPKWVTGLILTGLIAGSLFMQYSLIYARQPQVAMELINRTLADNSNGYLRAAADIGDIGDWLRHYPQAMPQFASEHIRTHPPGLTLLHWLTIKGMSKLPGLSAWLARIVIPHRCTDLWLLNQPQTVIAALGFWAFLPSLAAALTVWPAHVLARHLVGSEQARLAAAFTAVLPALSLFAPLPDQLFALLVVLIWLVLYIGLTRRTGIAFGAAGLIFSLSTFLSLGNGALLLPVALFMGFRWRADPTLSGRQLLNWTIAFGLGAAAIWLVYWLGWGISPWQIAHVGLEQHYELVTRYRSYSHWLLYNLVDLALFAGVPVLAILAQTAVSPSHNQPTAVKHLALSLLLFILILDVSGTARGEVGRLWLFFMPLLAIVTGIYVATHWRQRKAVALFMALQLGLTLSLGVAWEQVTAVIVIAERPSLPTKNTPTEPLSIQFETGIMLTGYDLDKEVVAAGETIQLTLYWVAQEPTIIAYSVFNHLTNPQGELVAQRDSWPVQGQWPSTCWQSNEVIVDTYVIELPTELPPSTYILGTGLYDGRNGTRLRANNGDDIISLTEITVIP